MSDNPLFDAYGEPCSKREGHDPHCPATVLPRSTQEAFLGAVDALEAIVHKTGTSTEANLLARTALDYLPERTP